MPQSLRPGMRVHFLGIGGFGINAIARVMHEQGYAVSGCDVAESPLIAPLRERGIPIERGHDPAHLDAFSPDALVISSAIPPGSAEVLAAHERGLPVYKRADVLGALMRDKIGVAVAGTHGKTTTTAMIAHTLDTCGLDPGFIIGGISRDLGTNARAGSGDVFVIEADEYDRMFMGLRPRIAVLTSLEMDHPDMFGSIEDVRALFAEFLDLLPPDGLLVACHDDPEVRALINRRLEAGSPAVTYGLTMQSLYHFSGIGWLAVGLEPQDGGTGFRVAYVLPPGPGETQGQTVVMDASLTLPGEHNVCNALAATLVAFELGIDPRRALDALATFSGVGRRFEVKGEVGGVTVIDDYAHHPTAIRATLEAARQRYGQRPVWAVWQPHTFSRTRALLDEFAACFAEADHVVITDVYRSRDRETFGITPESVLDRMPGHPNARHVPGPVGAVAEFLAAHVKSGDVVIVMSAGDATAVGDGLLAALGTGGD
jgi:UDP-N-acetylmuramate--alanine ligase